MKSVDTAIAVLILLPGVKIGVLIGTETRQEFRRFEKSERLDDGVFRLLEAIGLWCFFSFRSCASRWLPNADTHSADTQSSCLNANCSRKSLRLSSVTRGTKVSTTSATELHAPMVCEMLRGGCAKRHSPPTLIRVHTVRLDSCRVRFDRVAVEASCPAFSHLAATRVAGTQKQNIRFGHLSPLR